MQNCKILNQCTNRLNAGRKTQKKLSKGCNAVGNYFFNLPSMPGMTGTAGVDTPEALSENSNFLSEAYEDALDESSSP